MNYFKEKIKKRVSIVAITRSVVARSIFRYSVVGV